MLRPDSLACEAPAMRAGRAEANHAYTQWPLTSSKAFIVFKAACQFRLVACWHVHRGGVKVTARVHTPRVTVAGANPTWGLLSVRARVGMRTGAPNTLPPALLQPACRHSTEQRSNRKVHTYVAIAWLCMMHGCPICHARHMGIYGTRACKSHSVSRGVAHTLQTPSTGMLACMQAD
eukprot:365832-Chlamydomonas_euryale.AAC.6